MLTLRSESQYNEAHQKSRNELIQLLLDEIIFLGSCYNRAKNLYQQRTIRNAGSKLQKIINKQKKEKGKLIPYAEYKKIVKQIYDTMAEVINKF